MKTIILYYSYTGKTKALAVKKANELDAGIEEITDIKRPCMFKAFFSGVPNAIRRKKVKINPIKSGFSDYDKIIIMVPVWASHPAPAFNNIVEHIPSGKKVELIMISAGGGTKESAEKTIALVTARDCEVTAYTDVNAHEKNQ